MGGGAGVNGGASGWGVGVGPGGLVEGAKCGWRAMQVGVSRGAHTSQPIV